MPAPTSNAVWWIKNPATATTTTKTWAQQNRKQSMSTSFCADIADLFRNISMHGYSKLVSPQLGLSEKLIWLLVHTTTMCALLTVLSLIWEQFVGQYIVINLHNPLYPVELVAFPAISICSNNRISYRAALQHAEELRRRDSNNHTAKYFLDRLKYLSNFFYKSDRELDYIDVSTFQAFLDDFDTLDNETFYNTKRILKQLTPNCEEFVRRCTLAGVDIDCFGRRAFRSSLTSYGFCCTFNVENSYQTRSLRNQFVKPELGLTVILNTSRRDYFVPILNIDGYIVIVHDPEQFPDVASGEAQEAVISSGEETFLAIKARKVDTDLSLRSFGPRTRRCYFNDDTVNRELLVKTHYSFSNCITRCRIRSILALCRCLPFYMPSDLVNQQSGVVYCTLQHLPCLLGYSFKWNNVLTQRENLPGLERAYEEALFCPQCMPACDDIQYDLELISLPIDRYWESLTGKQIYSIGLTENETSVLRVHFDEPYAKYYRRIIGNTWFEALCTVGNVTSIFLGFSIVAIFEIFFVIIKYIVIGMRAGVNQNRSDSDMKKSADMKLYICP